MFSTFAHSGVDAIQTAKKQFVDTFAPTQEIKKISNEFVDAQSEYTKKAIDTGVKTATDFMELLTDRTPYVEAQKFFQNFFPSTAPVAKKGK